MEPNELEITNGLTVFLTMFFTILKQTNGILLQKHSTLPQKAPSYQMGMNILFDSFVQLTRLDIAESNDCT